MKEMDCSHPVVPSSVFGGNDRYLYLVFPVTGPSASTMVYQELPSSKWITHNGAYHPGTSLGF